MALHDNLTGLANRHQFTCAGRTCSQLAKRSRRHHDPAQYRSCNDFKSINDTYGHAAGDAAVLVQVANTAARLLPRDRSAGAAGRRRIRGADEDLPDTQMGRDGKNITWKALLDRLRGAVDVELPGSAPVRLGISIGVATCSDTTPTLDSLMRQADEAMYRAKEANQQLRSAA